MKNNIWFSKVRIEDQGTHYLAKTYIYRGSQIIDEFEQVFNYKCDTSYITKAFTKALNQYIKHELKGGR